MSAFRAFALALALAFGACNASFVAPEDDRCTLYVRSGEPANITRW